MKQPDYKLSESTFSTPSALFLNTGPLIQNPDIKGSPPELKLNDYVVFDEAQVRMRYLLETDSYL